MSQANLLVIKGTGHGTRYDLEKNTTSLGRGSQCDIRVSDHLVSRRHAAIVFENNEYILRDEKSSNGTLVNGKIRTKHTLINGDRIHIGNSIFLFSQATAQSSQELAVSRIAMLSNTVDADRSRIVSEVSDRTVAAFSGVNPAESIAEQAEMVAQLTTLYQISEEVTRPSLSQDQLLDRILYLTTEVVGADRGCILLFDPDTGKIAPRVFTDRGQQKGQMPVSSSIVDYVLKEKQGVRTSDAQSDQRFDSGQSILQAGIREAMCVPLQGRDEILGVMYVDTTMTTEELMYRGEEEDHFTDDKLRLMVAIGGQAALSVENHHYQEALVKAERLAAVGQTIAMLSHHIKNILQGIKGGSYLIDKGLQDMNENMLHQGWGIIQKNQDKIFHLVMDMLTYSTEKQPAFETRQLNETIEDVCELARSRAAEIGVEFSSELDKSIPTGMYDPEGIHRAVLNIALNALDAVEGAESPQVIVSTRYDSDQDQLAVIVEDNGPGIPPDILNKIFNIFESTKGSKGTGIGLPVSRKILREHRGEIHVETRAGEGSRFILEWPRVDEDNRLADNRTMM